MSDPVSTAFKQHGKTKRSSHRQLLIAGAGAVLLVVFLMRRKSAAPAAVPAAVDASQLPPAAGSGTPATFADNGAQAATLGDNVTSSLSGLQTSLDSQTSAFQGLTDQIGQQQAAATAAQAAAASQQTAAATQQQSYTPAQQPAYVAPQPPNTPAGRVGQPTRVNRQAGNPRQGQTYRTVQLSGGRTEHIYAGGKKVVIPPKRRR